MSVTSYFNLMHCDLDFAGVFFFFLGGGRLSRGPMLSVNLAYKFSRVHCR